MSIICGSIYDYNGSFCRRNILFSKEQCVAWPHSNTPYVMCEWIKEKD